MEDEPDCSAADIDGVIAGLGASGLPADGVVADIVAERRPNNQCMRGAPPPNDHWR